MAKLNKSQNWELILEAITDVVNNTDTLKKGKEELIESELVNALSFLKPKQGGGTSSKINENGEVYCNYFKRYLPAEEINTKLSKADKTTGERHTVYKANCKEAETILRKIKVLRYNVEKQAIENFKDKTINSEQMEEILNTLEDKLSGKIMSVEDVPTVADIIGLN